MKELIKKETIELLKLFRAKIGTESLDNRQLEKLGREYLGRKFMGVSSYDSYPFKNGYTIINTDKSNQSGTHWMMTYQKNKIIYVYDSFGRKSKNVLKIFCKNALELGYQIIDIDLITDQANKQKDCGLRSFITALMIDKYGIKSVFDY